MNVVQIDNVDLEGCRFNGHNLSKYLLEEGHSAYELVWYKWSQNLDMVKTISSSILDREDLKNIFSKLHEYYSAQALFHPSSYALLFDKNFLKSDIAHYHLFCNSFNLRDLPILTAIKPTVWTLHDPWALTGHCIHFFDCEKWKVGCGDCPNLQTEITIKNDTTALNWEMKNIYYKASNFDIIVASQWMKNLVEESPLFIDKKVHLIPFGLDLAVFSPKDKKSLKSFFNIPNENFVIACRASQWPLKGLKYVKLCLEQLVNKNNKDITIITVNDKGLLKTYEQHFQVIDLGWINDEELLVKFYSVADLFLMPSVAESFGVSAIESMACGTPVIAFDGTALNEVICPPRGGIIVPKNDVDQLYNEINTLIGDREKLSLLSHGARNLAAEKFDKARYVNRVIQVYREVANKFKNYTRSKYIIEQQLKINLPNVNILPDYSSQLANLNNKPLFQSQSKVVCMHNFNPKISIIIPVYNGSNYLKEAIDSAIKQTYQNIEIIVVNDGSNDDDATEKIALSYGDKIKYFSKANGGVATALNLGIEKMTGEYFSWLSHDDVYYLNKVEVLVNELAFLEDKKTILYASYELIDENSTFITQVKLNHEELTEKPLYSILRGSVHGCAMLIHRDCFNVVGLFNTKLLDTQDYDLWFKMIQRYTFKHVEQYLIKSRWHSEQWSKKSPRVLEECNELWVDMMTGLTLEQKLQCEKTEYLFYVELAKFLKGTPYNIAYQHANKLASDNEEYIKNIVMPALTVSVIIPFNDRVYWLLEAVKSVIQQNTIANLEVLLINNGCIENLSLLEDLILSDSRIKLLNQTMFGTSHARNMGIDESTGEYIAFLDADDLWSNNKVEIQLYNCLLFGYKFSHTSYTTFDAQGNKNTIQSGLQSGNIFPSLISNCQIHPSTVMLEKKILVENNLKFPVVEYSIGEDVSFFIDVAEKYAINGIDTSLSEIRIHGKNAAYDERKQFIGTNNIINHVLKTKSFEIVQPYIVELGENFKAFKKQDEYISEVVNSNNLTGPENDMIVQQTLKELNFVKRDVEYIKNTIKKVNNVLSSEFPTEILHENTQEEVLFDMGWYISLYGEMEDPLNYFNQEGWKKQQNPHPLFDTVYYIDKNYLNDLNYSPLIHFMNIGAKYGFQPHPLFDTLWYLESNIDVDIAGINPLVHYLNHGWRENRNPNKFFDSAWYLETYKDVAAAQMNPLIHYLLHGGKEGRNPSVRFNTSHYLAANPDVSANGMNALVHYIVFGQYEGRRALP